MEEQVGIWWHQLLNRMAGAQHADAGVALPALSQQLGVLFRALGGAHGVPLDAVAGVRHGARRSVLERMAGARAKVELASVDAHALRLPGRIDAYADPALNRALYQWLVALCAVTPQQGSWWLRNQQGSRFLLDHYAGLATSYRQLLAAELQRRPDPQGLPADQARAERRLRRALEDPGSVAELPVCARPLEPVLLWLSPVEPLTQGRSGSAASAATPPAGAASAQQDRKRRAAQQAELPSRDGGLLIFRPESIFSWTEYAKVEHEIQDNEDEDLLQAADDLDVLSVSDDERSVAKKLRMNLDRAARSEIADSGAPADIRVPEWDYRSQQLRPAHCAIRLQPPGTTTACELPARLHADRRRMHRGLAALTPERQLRRRQAHGEEIDLDACIRLRGSGGSDDSDCYQSVRRRQRDLSCLLLADLSLSTEAAIDGELRVIDVIRDSLMLFAESLAVTRDRFALYGFSSRQRHDVRISALKRFDQAYDGEVRGRIAAIGPSFYTRMGAAIRYASEVLGKERSRERILLLLTDGKPNDSDCYEGRYGVEDTRKALVAARQKGLRPFCVTIDQTAEDYLPHIFGNKGFVIIRRPAELPRRLALLYAQLTRSAH
ncbi:MAG: VWA domain-containing protein [Pseudomonadota bacterium]|nr:VWA domain-containing protein [Pseudomonadota bacterium]